MSVSDAATAHALPSETSGHRAPGWWGTLLLIATEATLFLYLLGAYFYVRFTAPVWPPPGIDRPELLLPVINTVILLSSSVPMHWADTAIARGDQSRLRLGLALSFILGAIFLGIQLYEYGHLGYTPQTNVYGSLFFTITGLHGAHVLVGLLFSALTQVRA